MSSTWTTSVRYAEADQQGVVFNAHYLTYCDEAMTAFSREQGLLELFADVHLVSSSLTWKAPARWGDLLEVDASCVRVGTSSFAMHFDIRVGEQLCCVVETTYVLVDAGRPVPLPDSARAALGAR